MKNNTGRNLCTSDQATLSCRFLTGPDRLLFSRGVVEALGGAPYVGLYVDTADRYFAVQAFSKKERCCFPFFNTQFNADGGVVLPYETVVHFLRSLCPTWEAGKEYELYDSVFREYEQAIVFDMWNYR